MAALKEQLLYHNINKRFFIKELTFNTGEAIY
jgi:hypothetical protein